MAETVIKIENLSKLYRLGTVSTGSMVHDVNRWWATVRGKEDPYLKIGEANDRSAKSGRSDYLWALKDINIDIKQGEIVGIIGKNGAGKSTLLKLLSRTTSPTTGSIKVKGRIASLLEVGTGFHPELTGRENIYLNGAILGMTKLEIKQKFDEIVDFAGVERYIDTPVKRYSSGMYVRLAFAVAAHLESEILVIDEVLAVGDLEFQKKCLGKMGDIANNQGKTVLFVSHDLTAVSKLCKTGVFLTNGEVSAIGEINQVLDQYLLRYSSGRSEFIFDPSAFPIDQEACIQKLQIMDLNDNLVSEVPIGDFWQVKIFFSIKEPMDSFIVALGFQTNLGFPIRTLYSDAIAIAPGEYCATFREEYIFLASGEYSLVIGLSNYERTIHYSDNFAIMRISDVKGASSNDSFLRTKGTGVILNKSNIKIDNI